MVFKNTRIITHHWTYGHLCYYSLLYIKILIALLLFTVYKKTYYSLLCIIISVIQEYLYDILIIAYTVCPLIVLLLIIVYKNTYSIITYYCIQCYCCNNTHFVTHYNIYKHSFYCSLWHLRTLVLLPLIVHVNTPCIIAHDCV